MEIMFVVLLFLFLCFANFITTLVVLVVINGLFNRSVNSSNYIKSNDQISAGQHNRSLI
jgi:hypothetical protein